MIRRLQRMNGIVDDLVDNIVTDASNQKGVVAEAINIVDAVSGKIDEMLYNQRKISKALAKACKALSVSSAQSPHKPTSSL